MNTMTKWTVRFASECVKAIATAVMLLMIAAQVTRAEPSPLPATRPAPATSVWQQPARLMPLWQSRGVKTLILYSPADGVSLDDYCKQAKANKLKYVLQGDGTCESHYGDQECVGILVTPDEPNSGHPGDPGFFSPGYVTDAVLNIRRKPGGSGKPIWISLAGWNLQFQSDDDLKAWCQTVDVVSFDYYVINRGEGPSAIAKLPALVDRIHRLAPDKQIVVDVETSDQKIPNGILPPPAPGERNRPPTTSEFLDEVTASFAHGAGVMYFSHISGGGNVPWQGFDGTTDEISGAMIALAKVKP